MRPGGGRAITLRPRPPCRPARSRGGTLMERPDPDPAAGDARTLSFAAYRIDAELLQRLLRYERTLLAELQKGWGPTAMASAHGAALASSGLSQEVLERALAVMWRF